MDYTEKLITSSEVLAQVAKIVKNSYPEIKRISLFGSYAKNTMGPLSDIDLIIEEPANIKPMKMWALSGDLIEALRKPIDIMRLSDVDTNSNFYKELEDTKLNVL